MFQELAEEIENTARTVVEQIHTILPGRIIEFNEKNCKVKASIYGKFVTSSGDELEYPIITEAPLVFPFSAKKNTGLVFPVASGDDCLILVSEVELDEWRTGAESEGSLRFDLTNAVVLPGLIDTNSLVKEAVKNEATIISNGDNKITIGKNGVEIVSKSIKLVSDNVTVASKAFTVEGNINYTGTCKKA